MTNTAYEAWLNYGQLKSGSLYNQYIDWCVELVVTEDNETIQAAAAEFIQGMTSMLGKAPLLTAKPEGPCIVIGTFQGGNPLISRVFAGERTDSLGPEGFLIRTNATEQCIAVGASTPVGILYGVFHLLRLIGTESEIDALNLSMSPVNGLRMINHWDNFDGSIERGYAGRSFFYESNQFLNDTKRLRDYARLMSSVGINAISINNVNVHELESLFITEQYLPDIALIAGIFRVYGIKLFLSANFASPIQIGALETADPLDPAVRQWWKDKAGEVYRVIPDFGGFVVKADSENRPGPFTYGRDHADGANMLGEALEPFGGIVIWRCFVYNCKQDWRDRKTDRARAAYDHFKPLDGRFNDNVVLQIKNGPMDFQVREPVSPLFGALEHTNHLMEFQIAQEYTGQQRHLCYLVPQWKEVLDFNTYAKGQTTLVKHIVDGSVWGNKYNGVAAVTNVGDDMNWTGHGLAQANLYGYGRLIWNPELTAKEIAEEWIRLTFGTDKGLVVAIRGMLMDSWRIYESYTAPLGVGWMVNPDHHYGPNVDGYEYAKWGTYHYADHKGIGVDRSVKSGTGYSGQYMGLNASNYENLASCPEELLLFFHHVPYTHVLQSGQTVIQHIYDTHFEGAEQAAQLLATWESLEGSMDSGLYVQVKQRLEEQAEHAQEWRDRINTYFYRKSGIEDLKGRKIY
ncbi:alpha-glucuronidase [Paenibacillus odorifer]|uniref:alpha-glucuronidase family glycosyl hydrolase n=1 Tax=Paenibacillus odorifer TaxID=189426 RepID=UPI00096DF94D|nr:alpha-glucuronidase family glycosyl hydrolase [Paenibacillus odorifer]OMC75971.1 alpha-glucuronidase [Paenibacillus odorifer]OMD97643.1 alpha-glucuronidase [Paenibacillus odorifer]